MSMAMITKAFSEITQVWRNELQVVSSIPEDQQIRLSQEELRALFNADLDAANRAHFAH